VPRLFDAYKSVMKRSGGAAKTAPAAKPAKAAAAPKAAAPAAAKKAAPKKAAAKKPSK
jgi:hypothetical protein